MRNEKRRWRRGRKKTVEKGRKETQCSHSRLPNINIRFPQPQDFPGSCQDGTSVPATREDENTRQ